VIALRIYSLFYVCLLFIVAVIALARYKVLDQASKVFCLLIVITSFTECIALYCSHFLHNNTQVYAIFNILQMVLTCLYFNYSIDVFYKWNLGYHFAALSIIAGVLNLIYLQPINTFSSYYLVFECLGVISMSLFSFFRLLLMHEQLRIKYYFHFWLPTCLIFFWSVTFFCWSLHDYLDHSGITNSWLLYLVIITTDILTYSSIGFLFLYYPKMKEKC